MGVVMCADMCRNMCIVMHVKVWANMCVDVSAGMYEDKCLCMCIEMCSRQCVLDMCIRQCATDRSRDGSAKILDSTPMDLDVVVETLLSATSSFCAPSSAAPNLCGDMPGHTCVGMHIDRSIDMVVDTCEDMCVDVRPDRCRQVYTYLFCNAYV